jgi:sec-independent protein translocase protein TatA
MGELSPFHWLVVLVVVMVLFGGRRIPEVMRGLGEGIRSFKEGMRDNEPGSTNSSIAAPHANTASPAIAPEKK